jgi:hypothetical protein
MRLHRQVLHPAHAAAAFDFADARKYFPPRLSPSGESDEIVVAHSLQNQKCG